MRTASFLMLAFLLAMAGSERTHAQPKGQPKRPLDHYAMFRQAMNEGKFDIAGIYLDEFLKSDPTDADFLEIEKKHGTTVFQQLRAVPKFSDDPANEKKIRDNIEEINRRAKDAIGKILYDKERVAKYVRNLGETYEEKVFAQQELKRTGEFAVPFMLEALRQNPDRDLYAGILDTIPVLDGHTMAGWVAALDGLTADRQYGVIDALSKRRDVLNLLNDAQTDFTPILWRILAGDPRQTPENLRELALNLLNRFHPGIKADTKRPEVELTAIAKRFYEGKARYLGARTNPDGSPSLVPLWTTSVANGILTLTKLPDVPVRQADEYYGLRYARWALESKEEYAPAQQLILSLAAERAAERSGFGRLAVAEPEVYRLLADAPSTLLNELLNRGLNEKRTSLVLAMVQVLGDRADRDAATPPAGNTAKPSLLVRALNYPDPAVQFAAATALLRAPVPVPAASRPLIVDVLRRAAAIDPGAPGEARGTVLLADPNKQRAGMNSLMIRSFGFTVEYFNNGRDLLRRVARSSDFDMIFIDQHTANPELIDLVSQLESDVRTAARPIFVIASADKPRVPTFDQLMLRISALIAATDNDVIAMASPYVPDPRDTVEEQVTKRRTNQESRDGTFRITAAARTRRLQNVLDTLPLTLTEQQQRTMNLRIQLIVFSVLSKEFPMSEASAPESVAEISRLRRQIALQPPSQPYGVGIASADLMKLIDRFELDVANVKFAQDKYEMLRMSLDPVEIGIPVESYRDAVAEAKLARTFTHYPAVRIIPELYSRVTLDGEFRTLFADPMRQPRSQTVKQAEAKVAVEFLRQMAIGDLPGYDLRSVEVELRDLLRHPDPDVASAALDAVERFKSADAQLALLQVAIIPEELSHKPITLRRKAADAVIRHIRANGNALPNERVADIIRLADVNDPQGERDNELRGKFLTLRGIIAHKPGKFVDELKVYNPPIIPGPPKKDPDPMKEPEPKP